MSVLLSGQQIFVTGAGGGIGREVVKALVENGAVVVGTDLSVDRESHASLFLECDVTNQESIDAAVKAATDQLGPLTGLAYVSGRLHEATPLAEFDLDVWDTVFDVNVKGVVRCARAIAPQLKPGASIVTTTSWWSNSGKAYFAAYCASKAALKSLTQSMAD